MNFFSRCNYSFSCRIIIFTKIYEPEFMIWTLKSSARIRLDQIGQSFCRSFYSVVNDVVSSDA